MIYDLFYEGCRVIGGGHMAELLCAQSVADRIQGRLGWSFTDERKKIVQQK